MINLILSHLFLLHFISSRIILETLKLTKISIAWNAMFINNSFKIFNLILLFCCMVLIFVNNQLNDMNIIISFSNSNKISKININIYVLKFGTCNIVWSEDSILLCNFNFGKCESNLSFLFESILITLMEFNWISLNKLISMNNSLMN